MADFEEQLNNLLNRAKTIKAPINAAPIGICLLYTSPSPRDA